ncbi:MAG TPA: aminodeoxychorismate synthase component I [Chitinophagaceae bacterium]|nr:aminodeoxychorismate synthase component I [Chitinophagaceae bacterium]
MPNRTIWIEKINDRALRGVPFFLFIDYEMKNPLLVEADQLEEENIHIHFPSYQSKDPQTNHLQPLIHPHPISFERYQQSFRYVQQQLHYGNSYLCNLTVQTPLELNGTLSDIYMLSRAQYKILFKDEWVCFSPEQFISIQGNQIHTFPMKGTIDASIPDAENKILNDPKEKAEHYTIVDLLRNDLSLVASDVKVVSFRDIQRIHTSAKTLLQVSSHIQGTLPPDFRSRLGELIFSLLPAGSISGAPKISTMKIIHEAEHYTRGFYTGTAYYYNGSDLDSCVLIRFIEKTDSGYVYKSGGGITIHSRAEDEYREINDKIYVPLI